MQDRQLILMRHATAESGGPRDHERALSRRGHDEAHRVGVSLRELGLVPEVVLCSTALRCRQTWRAVSVGLGASPTVDFDAALYGASADRLLDVIAGLDDAHSVLVLAHNPGVSVLAMELARSGVDGASPLRSGFAPATIACFEVAGPWSSLSASTARLARVEAPSMG